MQPPTQGGGRKRQNLTLDLNSASAKKNRVQNLLTSPDVQMFKLSNSSCCEHTRYIKCSSPYPSSYCGTIYSS